MDSVKATWVGPSGHELFDGTMLVPGETVCEIGGDEARDNPYWKATKKGDPVNELSFITPVAELPAGDEPKPDDAGTTDQSGGEA